MACRPRAGRHRSMRLGCYTESVTCRAGGHDVPYGAEHRATDFSPACEETFRGPPDDMARGRASSSGNTRRSGDIGGVSETVEVGRYDRIPFQIRRRDLGGATAGAPEGGVAVVLGPGRLLGAEAALGASSLAQLGSRKSLPLVASIRADIGPSGAWPSARAAGAGTSS